eukprot:GHVU01070714.1.p4 GENE.GHVU01070714.1~~GHVU01070714.1.p4  ORF type:complete len:114 (+),score=2.00 GHVU01070714.1:469-810(+)
MATERGKTETHAHPDIHLNRHAPLRITPPSPPASILRLLWRAADDAAPRDEAPLSLTHSLTLSHVHARVHAPRRPQSFMYFVYSFTDSPIYSFIRSSIQPTNQCCTACSPRWA